MTGSLRSSKGKFYAVLNLKDESGKRKQKSVNLHIEDVPGNKRKAEKALREVLAEYEQKHITVYRKEVLFCDYVKVWLEDAKPDLKQSTYEAYTYNVEGHIYPYFKKCGINLSDVEYASLKDYYTSKSKCLSSNTLKKHHAIIKQTLRHAVQNRLIANNPAAEIRFPKGEKFKGNFLTTEQGDTLLEAVSGTPLEPAIVLAMMYGLRRSEVAGLKWDAVDFNANTLTIRHTVTRVKTEVARDGTKNQSSNRTLPLNDGLRRYLKKLRVKQAEEKLLLGAGYQNTEYICRWADGRPLKCGYLSAGFKQFLVKQGLPLVRFHDLRHSCASFLLKAGCSMKEISDWLGHSNIQTSMDIYAHLDMVAKQEVANRVGSILAVKV